MKKTLTVAGQALAPYRLAIFIGILFSINALSSSITASVVNVEWSQLSPTSKFLLFVLVLQNWTGVMLAYFNKTLSRVEKGETPVGTGDTTILTASETVKPPNP